MPLLTFVDVVTGSAASPIPVKQVQLHRGEPAVHFSTAEIQEMVEPFKLALIGKFSFGRPPMDFIRKFFTSLELKGNSQISLLDNRHILIKLEIEEDFSRIWVRQSWYVNGRGIRIFKWSIEFHCSVESPIVHVWVSFPYLPVYFVHCKLTLFSIAFVVGTPLRVDHATTLINRPSVARLLVTYDISRLLLPRIWIGKGDLGFWEDVNFGKMLFLSEFQPIVIHVSIWAIRRMVVTLLILDFINTKLRVQILRIITNNIHMLQMCSLRWFLLPSI